ncbi:MAG: bifunctional adenosylcobinamide kinase/adenosylcobinamide-phosphate guanylyltransferase [Eubacteriales bacterium]|nr:bifunctional adenosylcobinamide kinase/adenosylcobinamide-phosphate guanylyltransferase [Eubacteriales bacterium]
MILIAGGSSQGKTAFLRGCEEKTGKPGRLSEGDGLCDPWQEAFGKEILLHFHGYIRQVLEAGEDPQQFVRQILKQMPEYVTIDEVGCGIVPIKRCGRDYREACGEAGQLLAARAEQVYRVVCGIGTRIK